MDPADYVTISTALIALVISHNVLLVLKDTNYSTLKMEKTSVCLISIVVSEASTMLKQKLVMLAHALDYLVLILDVQEPLIIASKTQLNAQ
jgi:hypothetical protein